MSEFGEFAPDERLGRERLLLSGGATWQQSSDELGQT